MNAMNRKLALAGVALVVLTAAVLWGRRVVSPGGQAVGLDPSVSKGAGDSGSSGVGGEVSKDTSVVRVTLTPVGAPSVFDWQPFMGKGGSPTTTVKSKPFGMLAHANLWARQGWIVAALTDLGQDFELQVTLLACGKGDVVSVTLAPHIMFKMDGSTGPNGLDHLILKLGADLTASGAILPDGTAFEATFTKESIGPNKNSVVNLYEMDMVAGGETLLMTYQASGVYDEYWSEYDGPGSQRIEVLASQGFLMPKGVLRSPPKEQFNLKCGQPVVVPIRMASTVSYVDSQAKPGAAGRPLTVDVSLDASLEMELLIAGTYFGAVGGQPVSGKLYIGNEEDEEWAFKALQPDATQPSGGESAPGAE